MFPWTGSDLSAKRIKVAAIVFALAAIFICAMVKTSPAGENVWAPLTDRLVADGFDRAYITPLFSNTKPTFSPEIMARKMNALLKSKLSAAKPAKREKPKAMQRYLNPILIAGAYSFYRENRDELARIEKRYQVPGDLLTALMLVETKLGRQVGDHNALGILANMAIASDFELIRPHIRRDVPEELQGWLERRTGQKASWGYGELKSLLTYARKNGADPLTIPSSMYGAIGLCQFIPSSALAYGVDGSGDGKVDLFDTRDALYSMANFIRKHGWKPGLDHEAQVKIVYRYNHSESYALTILEVADRIRKTDEFFGD
ncbi:murein transglycosylase [Pseudodesulfovibrio cashew]|uniref:Murein transglycosylase n=1 Tax=Pseudodesulfovibrio cashew TaxID=2678688 RepID=A0A6I6JLC0_9BACT|nr:lytic murein transglycosylase [Pseudodesulfovibrio cashew]QGY40937.1 murein transglycosylase [Pseudodesulfovibrio cashew]